MIGDAPAWLGNYPSSSLKGVTLIEKKKGCHL